MLIVRKSVMPQAKLGVALFLPVPYICIHSFFLALASYRLKFAHSFVRASAFGLHLELFMESVFLLFIPITVHFQLFSLEMFSILVHIFTGLGFLLLHYYMYSACFCCSILFVLLQ